MSEIRSDIDAIKKDLNEMDREIARLPTYPGLAVLMAVVGGALMAVSRLFPSGPP